MRKWDKDCDDTSIVDFVQQLRQTGISNVFYMYVHEITEPT